MKQIKDLFVNIGVSCVLLFAAVTCFGQGTIEPSYEVSVQLVMGSNATGNDALPTSLGGISQQLKRNFAYKNYRLGTTILSRMSNHSDFEYKSYANLTGSENDSRMRNFLEMSIRGLKKGETDPAGFNIQSMRLGARVPVVMGTNKDPDGKDVPVVNYENIGLTINRVAIPTNNPTIIGTLDMPTTNEMIFVVMTVRAAAQ